MVLGRRIWIAHAFPRMLLVAACIHVPRPTIEVYCELFPWDAPMEKVMAIQPSGIILSGGPNSVYDDGAPTLPDYVIKAGVPILGIWYDMHLTAPGLCGVVCWFVSQFGRLMS